MQHIVQLLGGAKGRKQAIWWIWFELWMLIAVGILRFVG